MYVDVRSGELGRSRKGVLPAATAAAVMLLATVRVHVLSWADDDLLL